MVGLACKNTGQIRDVANAGIFNVRLQVTAGFKCVVVDSMQGRYYLSPGGRNGKMMVMDPHSCTGPERAQVSMQMLVYRAASANRHFQMARPPISSPRRNACEDPKIVAKQAPYVRRLVREHV